MSPFVHTIPVFMLLIIIGVCTGIFLKKKGNPATSIELRVYTAAQYALLIVAISVLATVSHLFPLWLNLVLVGLLLVNLMIISCLSKKKSGLQRLEIIRFILSLAGLLACYWLEPSKEHWFWQFILAWGGLSLVIMKSLGINQAASAQPQ